jgi:hypothetical protein
MIEHHRVLLKELMWYVSKTDISSYNKEFSPITDPPSPSLLSGMSSRRKKFIKVEGIESTLPIALPKQEW